MTLGIDHLGRRQVILGGAAALGVGALSSQQLWSAVPTNELDEKQLGQLAFVDALARQIPSDWSHMGSAEPGQGGFDAYRYQLAMMSYALSLANYHYTPAWRDRHHQISKQLIDKMMQFDVWSYWELTSRGAKVTDPDLTELGSGSIDPVRFQNIMYSGHLLQMVTTHDMLFGGREHEREGSILFDYNPVARGLGRQTFSYDVHSLTQVLIDQFRINGWRGIECEPNAIFPECNQHPLLGFALYDARYGTDKFKQVSRRFQEQFDQLGYLGANSSYMAFLFVKQNRIVPGTEAWGDGWTGTFLHGWNRAVSEGSYPEQRHRYLRVLPDGTATIARPDRLAAYSHGHGFLATMAAELGDAKTRDALLGYADLYWNPQWDGEALRYPRFDDFKSAGDGPDIWRRVQPLTGNGLLVLARIGGQNRIYDMFNKPFGDQHYGEPALAEVDYPRVHVSRARYDRAGQRLDFTLVPGRTAGRSLDASFKIVNVDPARPQVLAVNGRPVARVESGKIKNLDPMIKGSRAINSGMEWSIRLSRKESFSLIGV